MIIKKKKDNQNINKKQKDDSLNEVKSSEESIELFDLDNIDFSQRQERRRGNRRRGYRRIDDRNLISRAQEEASSIRENAMQEGYKLGVEQAQYDIEQLKTSLENFINAKQEVFEYIAPDILEISIDIARKIVKKEIEQDPEIILGNILDVLNTVSREDTKVSLKVNPNQVAFAKANIPEMAASLGIDAKITVVPDGAIDIGGCILYTGNGIVDSTIETQLEIIKEAFKGI